MRYTWNQLQLLFMLGSVLKFPNFNLTYSLFNIEDKEKRGGVLLIDDNNNDKRPIIFLYFGDFWVLWNDFTYLYIYKTFLY